MRTITLAVPISVMGETVAALTLPDELTVGDLWDLDLTGEVTVGRLMAIAAKVASWRTAGGETRIGIPVNEIKRLRGADLGAVLTAVGPLLAGCLGTGAISAAISPSPAGSPSTSLKR